ncbi:MAG: DUF3419 family protein [Hyphomicrobiaceae bacterium]|nr:DUF3419 family protein [Hyphomicrobiaceae bacterium]
MPTDPRQPAATSIAARAKFDDIRYGQLWEDADVLVGALGKRQGATLVSICSAGDNALALLLTDPARVIAIDMSQAQLACLHIRIAAMRCLDHEGFLELMGSYPSARRGALLAQAIAGLEASDLRAFWQARADAVVRHGLGGIGKFEGYFRLLRSMVLPLTHDRETLSAIFHSRPRAARAQFLDTRFNGWRWRLLMAMFFSRPVMGRLGRDPAFFDHVEGSVGAHVARRIRHAAVDLDPAENPYLHWILKGRHGEALPLPWRRSAYETIRERLGRVEVRHGTLEGLVASGLKADGFNLSDIFEYMDETTFAQVYGQILAAANPGARLVYWNMMAPRRAPPAYAGQVRVRHDDEATGKAADKAFFYSDFVVEEVVAS